MGVRSHENKGEEADSGPSKTRSRFADRRSQKTPAVAGPPFIPPLKRGEIGGREPCSKPP